MARLLWLVPCSLIPCLPCAPRPACAAELSEAAKGVRQIVAHRGASAVRPESTLSALRAAIDAGATAVEIDVRTSKDGVLFLLHDATLDRTTDGSGPAHQRTMAELKKLDAGGWFDANYRGERIPTLEEALRLCRGRIDVLLDLKQQGAAYARAVAGEVRGHGEMARTILGVRSVEQARRFRRLLPAARQLGFIADPRQIEAFAEAGVDSIRLWPKWLSDPAVVRRIRRLGIRLHLNAATGTPGEIVPLLAHRPDSLLVDDPATLVATLDRLREGGGPFSYERWATRDRPLDVPRFEDARQWTAWQERRRAEFRRRFVFGYDAQPVIAQAGEPVDRGTFVQQAFHVYSDGERIFRFFRLVPKQSPKRRLPTIVCFMGHGKVRQILEDRASYQHACAARFAQQGYLVFAMENVGMEPEADTHLVLDRLLRLDGYGWYSLLFAHQQILLEHVFADPRVDTSRVGVTGVSTGGLLALSAAAFEPRVAAASVQGIFGSMRVSFIRDRGRHCQCGAIPGLLPHFDLPEMALLVAPRPIHFSNAAHDGFSPAEARRCVARITRLYQQAGGAAPELSEPPGRHEFAFEPASQFFRRTIGRP